MQNSKSFPRKPTILKSFTAILFSAERLLAIKTFFNYHSDISVRAIDLTVLQAAGDNEIKKMAEFYLSDLERQRFTGFKFSKRKTEWLAGRIAAKEAILALLPEDANNCAWHNLQISADSVGRPFCELVEGNTEKMPDVSITHSAGIAAALASSHFCGIDIQEIKATVAKVKSRFASPVEQLILSKANADFSETTLLAMLWSAKEAARKAFPLQPLPGFMELQLEHFNGKLDNFTGQFSCQRQDMPATIPFFCMKFEAYAGAIILR